MNLRDQTTDQQANEHGKWFDFDEETKCQIAAHMNQEHRKALQRLGKKYQGAIRKKNTAELDKLTIEGLADGVLLDWKGMKDGEAELPATRENKIRVLTLSRPFREWVVNQATDLENFLQETEAADKADLKRAATLDTPVE